MNHYRNCTWPAFERFVVYFTVPFLDARPLVLDILAAQTKLLQCADSRVQDSERDTRAEGADRLDDAVDALDFLDVAIPVQYQYTDNCIESGADGTRSRADANILVETRFDLERGDVQRGVIFRQ